MPKFDWEPICQFVNTPPILVDGRCQSCLQDTFPFDGGYVCPQCGTMWASPDYEPTCYKDWTDNDPEGLPVMDRRSRGLGIYR